MFVLLVIPFLLMASASDNNMVGKLTLLQCSEMNIAFEDIAFVDSSYLDNWLSNGKMFSAKNMHAICILHTYLKDLNYCIFETSMTTS